MGEHRERTLLTADHRSVCKQCGEPWPCEVVRLRRALDEAAMALTDKSGTLAAELASEGVPLLIGGLRTRIKDLEKALRRIQVKAGPDVDVSNPLCAIWQIAMNALAAKGDDRASV